MAQTAESARWKPETVAAAAAAAVGLTGVAAAAYFWKQNAALSARLRDAEEAESLRSRALANGLAAGVDTPPGKKVRIYIDGCFDCYHFGHSNALRQARAVGDVLLVGVHTDSEVQRIKGSAPVTPEQERYAALRACKFVDEVIEGAPYVPTKEWIDTLRSQYGVDYIVHGDDPCFTPDGQDAYAYAKELNMFKIVKRTEGVSTTDLVGRMLLMTREHHVHTPVDPAASGDFKRLRSASWADEATTTAGQSHFLPTARRIRQFASDRVPTKSDKVVYLPGAFDLFTEGHIQAMKAAKALGTFLVVGVYDDQTVNKVQGGGHPVMNLHERSLSVLACRYADEVIIGAPRHVTEDLLTSMNVSVVAHGTASEGKYLQSFGQGVDTPDDPFFVAKKAGKFHVFASPSSMLVTTVIERVMAHREELAAKVKRKAKAESSYYSNTKTYVSEG